MPLYKVKAIAGTFKECYKTKMHVPISENC